MRLQIRPTRAIAVLATLTIASIMAGVTFLLWNLRKHELEHARLETVSLARMLMEQTEQSFDGVDRALRGVQEQLQTASGSRFALDSAPVQLLLSARSYNMPQVVTLFIVDSAGTVVNSARQQPPPPISVTDREYYKAFADGKRGGRFVGTPVRSRLDDSWTLHLARRLVTADGKFHGVVAAALSLENFDQLYDLAKLDFVRPIALYLADGTLIGCLPRRENAIGERVPELGPENFPAPGKGVQVVSQPGGDGTRQLLALGRVEGFPLLVSVTNDEADALAAWRDTAVPIALGSGLVSLFIAVVAWGLARELRREQELTRALREADDRYRGTIDSVMDAIVAIDAAHKISMFNPAAERMFGLSAQEVIGSPLERLMPARYREAHRWHIDEFTHSDVRTRTMAAQQVEIVGLRADGSEFPIESTIAQTIIDGKPQLTAVLRDVTDCRRAEAEQREMNRQLRRLSASLQDVREQERSRIARELHDELGQQLTGLKLDLSWLSGRLREGRPAAPDKMDAMRQLLDTAIASVRRISTELRPLILDDLGFGEAVAWQTGEFSKRSGIELALDLAAAERVRDGALATALFRIVQESLTNIARHAEATRAEIRLAAAGDNLVLTVRDNGKGARSNIKRSGGLGLVSMRERITALGGNFAIISSPGEGTTVEVTVPQQPPAAEESNA